MKYSVQTFRNKSELTPASLFQTSLFLTSLPPSATEEHIRSYYLSTPGLAASALKSVVLVPTSKVAFVNFVDRKSAEVAADRSSVGVVVDGVTVKCAWGRSRPKKVGGPGPPATGELSVIKEREVASSGK